ncbi:MAG: 8-oxoguanine deaminase [Thermotogaceae bacterium]|nr:8-oxoguanine deaminase [Thermotogaceae bacterium]
MKKLFKNIEYLATFDNDERELKNAYILVEDNVIKEVGTGEYEGEVDEIYDLDSMLVLPGFVNTHHHFYQTLFRNVKGAQNVKLFDWLVFLYERWKHIDEEASYVSALTAIYEMMLTGVTTTTDHLYLYPYGNNAIFDAEIEAAKRTGVRFHPTRGSMSLSRKDGGLPPDSVVQTEEEIIEESIRVIKQYHDPSKYSMLRIALAPCSPFSVTPEIMRESAKIAEEYDVLLHTHLAETLDEEEFCLEKFGKRPVDYMEEIGWLNPRVWFAHLVHLSDKDIEKLAKNDVGMAHCPASNMRLGSGIARVKDMKDKLRIGIAVDGSASNDTNNFLQEIRLAFLLQRVKYGAAAITAREVLRMATMGGARVLRMDDYIGSIEPGKAADFIGIRLDKIELAGCLDDPVASVVFCDPRRVDTVVINGNIRIWNGEIVGEDMQKIIEWQNRKSRELLAKEK